MEAFIYRFHPQWIKTKKLIDEGVIGDAPPDKVTRIFLNSGKSKKTITFPPIDQYTLQAEQFARSVMLNLPVPTPLSDAVFNMQLMDALVQSAEEGRLETL